MPSKYSPATSEDYAYTEINGGRNRHPYNKGASEIHYDDGPKYDATGGLNWKKCTHIKGLSNSGYLAQASFYSNLLGPRSRFIRCQANEKPEAFATSVSFEGSTAPKALWDLFHEQLDLNCKDRVQAYSGVIQLIPMLGTALRAGLVLKKISRWASHELRRKPFSTVVRAAIQADLIKRFVVETTVRDILMVNSSLDYCREQIERAAARSFAPAVAVRTNFFVGKTNHLSGSAEDHDSEIRVQYIGERRTGVDARLCVLSEVKYDYATVNPLKLWLTRCGLITPLESAWDLVPFSFVVDYVLRIGEGIEELGDQYTSQDGLVGEVGKISGAWYSTFTGSKTHLTGKSLVLAYPKYVSDFAGITGDQMFSNGIFRRYPADILSSRSGFWDKGGLWKPSLSSVRKRTIAELALLAARGNS